MRSLFLTSVLTQVHNNYKDRAKQFDLFSLPLVIYTRYLKRKVLMKGRKRLPWIKLWFEMLGDPKMTRLTLAERGCWHEILLLAGQSPIRGKLMLTETEPMTFEDVAKALRLTPDEFAVLQSCVEKLVKVNSLNWNEHNCLEVTHFTERQEKYPSDFEDYAKNPPKKVLDNSIKTPEKLRKEEEGRGERQNKEITPLSKDKGARKKRATPTEPLIKEILDEMKTYLGFPAKIDKDPIPNYGKEGSAIKRMLTRGFTREEVTNCWKQKVDVRGGEFVSMTWVNEDIGKKGGKRGEYRRHPEEHGPDTKYEWEEIDEADDTD